MLLIAAVGVAESRQTKSAITSVVCLSVIANCVRMSYH